MILISFLWAEILRRRIKSQKDLLREWSRREVALRRSYEELFENANDIIFTIDLNGNLTSINRAAEKLTGYSREEALGADISGYVTQEYRELAEQMLKRKLHDGSATTYYLEILTKNGRRVPLEISSRLIYEEEKPVGIQGIARDITERKFMEQQLLLRERRLASFFADAPAGLAILDQQLRFVQINETLAKCSGLSSQECIGKPLRQVVPKLAQVIEPAMQKVLRDGQPLINFLHEGETPCQPGVTRHLISSYFPIPALDDEGHDIAVIAVDVTDRKQMEEGLKLYKEVFARSNEAVAILDNKFHFLEQNAAHRRLLGYTDEELRRTNLIDITGEKAFAHFRELSRHSRSFRTEKQFRTRSETMLDVELSAFSIARSTGEVVCWVGLVRDISMQKRAELELQKARETAEAANRAKGEFLANMSHEIRTPLNGVLGMTELALNTELSEEQQDYLTMVKTSGEALLTVINDILDFSKIEAGRLDISPIDFDLRESLGETLKSLSLRAHQKGLELALHVAHHVPSHVLGDPTRLRQIIVNLVSNAIKFTDQGEVVLHVNVESLTETELHLHFIVADTGIGIPSDKQQVIFAPFTQADSSATRRYGGTGLGLSISFQLVKLMGGRLWVESEEGKGSRFHFIISFCPSASKRPRLGTSDMASLQGLPALVVDDNATNRRILEEILTSWDMRPAVAEGGGTGLAATEQAKAAGKTFPLVLLDASMPDMDGFSLAEKIHNDPELAGATIMMLTSAGRRGDADRCRELGVAVYLYKPIQERDLLRAILLALSPSRRDANEAGLITRHTLREERGSLRVLLAEDDLVNRQLAERQLRAFGCQVTAVPNGLKAIESIQASGPGGFDVVLMDVQMPEMDGLKATAAIRALERGTSVHLPIIAMTAHAMKGDRARFLEAGMDGYLAKPIQAHQLLTVIEETLQIGGKAFDEEGPKSPMKPAIDWKRGLARLEGDSELFRDLLRLFAHEAPAALGRLRDTIQCRDARGVEQIAHQLKGALANFGAEEAIQAASVVESMAKTGRLEHSENAVRGLEKEIRRVLAAIETPENEVAG